MRTATTPELIWLVGRAVRAHLNAVENLAVFAPLALAVHVTGAGTPLTAAASMTYFAARALHLI